MRHHPAPHPSARLRPAPRRKAPTTAAFALAAASIATAGCVTRSDYAVPDAPTPLAAAAALPPPRLDAPLSAADIVAMVKERNPGIARARARIEVALGQLDAAESALRPRLVAETSYLVADAPSAYLFKRIDAHNLPRTADFNDPGHLGNAEAALAARWNLWDGGRTRLTAWSAAADAEAARHGVDATTNALAAAALFAFLDSRAADDLLAADDASVRAVEAQVTETRTKVEGGGALRSDLLSLEVRLAEARERRISTDVARRLALTALRSLLALPSGTPLLLAGGSFEPGGVPATPAEALAEAYRHRPEVAAARRAVESARMRLDAAERGALPRVDVEARAWSDTGHTSADFQDPNWTVAVALSYDLFDGGATKAAVRRARGALREVEENDRRALLEVAADVESALLRLEEARARVAVTSQAIGASEESLGLVETQFRGGAATVTRFLEAESAATRARTADVSSRLALQRALVDVARALGRLGAAAPTAPEEVVR